MLLFTKLKDNSLKILPLLAVALLLHSCQEKETLTPVEVTSKDLQNAVDRVTEIMIHDIFSPPQASRIYVYPNIAAYEIIAQNDPGYKSLAGQIRDFTSLKTVTFGDESAVRPNRAAGIISILTIFLMWGIFTGSSLLPSFLHAPGPFVGLILPVGTGVG